MLQVERLPEDMRVLNAFFNQPADLKKQKVCSKEGLLVSLLNDVGPPLFS